MSRDKIDLIMKPGVAIDACHAIWKWQIPLQKNDPLSGVKALTKGHRLSIPKGSTILKLGIQDGMPTIWCLVYPDARSEERFFDIYGTGHEIQNYPCKYVGTFEMETKEIFHLFEDIGKMN